MGCLAARGAERGKASPQQLTSLALPPCQPGLCSQRGHSALSKEDLLTQVGHPASHAALCQRTPESEAAARPTPRAPGRRLLGRCLALAPTVSALTWLCFPAGHRRAGAPAADASHRAGVHGAEAGARHQAVPSDRESEGGFLRPVRQLTLPSAEEAGPLCW